MLIFKSLLAGLLASFFFLSLSFAQDSQNFVSNSAAQSKNLVPYGVQEEPWKGNHWQALNYGFSAYKEGNKEQAFRAFRFAAQKDHPLALWRLAALYEKGDGVGRDPYKAFEYYRRLCDLYADINRSAPLAGLVSRSFILLGRYYQAGIAGRVDIDLAQALALYTHAATHFGDRTAQYHLARIYMAQDSDHYHEKLAMRWLHHAARKNHPNAQALFGQALFHGRYGMPKMQAQGLLWLKRASSHYSAIPHHDMHKMYQNYVDQAESFARLFVEAYP